MHRINVFARNIWANSLLENFLIMAVAAILVIRLGLHLTGYPQLGGGGLHIAHMLWGGLGMLVAIILMLEFNNRSVREWAAVIGGIGFGAFIDELGKFITSDNDYFFQPTVAFIYIIFVILFLVVHWLNRSTSLSPSESLYSAAEIIQEGIHDGGLDDKERLTAQELLKSNNSGIAVELRNVMEKLDTLPEHRPGLLARLHHTLAACYSWLVSHGWFRWLVIGIFFADAAAGLVQAIIIGPDLLVNLPGSMDSLPDWVDLVSSIITAVLTIIGASVIHRSRLKAYLYFRSSMLISILVTDAFSFYQYQFLALEDIIVDLLLFMALRYMIDREKAQPSHALEQI